MATASQLRSQIASLSSAASAELAAVWGQIFTPSLSREREAVLDVGGSLAVWIAPVAKEASDALMDVLPTLVGDYSDAATVTAAQWYDEYRAGLSVPRSFTADLPELDLGAEALAGWGESLITEDADWDAALERISGGLQRRVADAGRETITHNVFNDPSGTGWQRQAKPTACGFCQMLAGRGEVYKSRDTADFGAHDHCQCVAVPAFGGLPVPVKPYVPSSANITDADRARARAWIKKNL